MIALTVVNNAHVPAAVVARTERAVQWQLNRELRRYWHTPLVAFRRSGGWQIRLDPPAVAERICHASDVDGCHYKPARGSPTAEVAVWNVWETEEFTSHEGLEIVADPSARFGRREVADPVEPAGYWHGGVLLAQFVTPTGGVVSR